MKILLVHNFYGSRAPSGENTVYAAERELLRQYGHTVIEFTRHSDEIINGGIFGTIRGAFTTLWNPFSKRVLESVLEKEKPDVMHVHNTFPLLSPSIFYATQDSKTAIVLTLHNYRTFCAAGILLRDCHPCTECLERESVFPALKYGCYRQSRLATLPLATMIALHRKVGTWSKRVDAFIVLTEFQKSKMTEAGLRSETVYVKPNFYLNPPNPLPWDEREPKAVYVGRLGVEKGVNILIDAWKMWSGDAPCLEIIGDGPEKSGLQKSINGDGLEGKVSLLGYLNPPEAQKRLATARLLLLPSLSFEGFPMAIPEAFALGVPVAASDIGAIPFIVKDNKNGILFKPGDASALYRAVKEIWDRSNWLSSLGQAARQEFNRKYTADANYEILMNIYQKAMERKKAKGTEHRA
ncbi:MAG: glycosyltransferase family 4 protein [Candidatus Aminicenantes bacterium]|nr:glycosyltransferase family 4 protein [Candidatus Aminicenantes bacterium]